MRPRVVRKWHFYMREKAKGMKCARWWITPPTVSKGRRTSGALSKGASLGDARRLEYVQRRVVVQLRWSGCPEVSSRRYQGQGLHISHSLRNGVLTTE